MSNEIRARLLGQPFGTATQRLRKLIMWSLVLETSKDICFRCGQQIEDVDDLSIEHKEPWQSAADPKASFFDLENIAFSHLSCNSGAPRSEKTHCPAGHPYDEENTRSQKCRNGRQCRECDRQRMRRRYRGTDWREQRKSFPSRTNKPS